MVIMSSIFLAAIGLLALMNDRWSHFADSKSSQNTTIINTLLKSIGFTGTIPDISVQTVVDPAITQLDNAVTTSTGA